MNSFFKILILFTISSIIYGGTSHVKKYEFDDNRDGVTDNIYSYSDGVLVGHRNDRNYDKQYDYRLTIKDNITRIESDNDFDNNFEKLEVITNHGEYSLYSEYEVIDGKSKLLKTEKVKNYDNQFSEVNRCSYENYISNIGSIDKFVSDFKFIVSSMNDGISQVQNGYQVHKSCFDHLGEKKFSGMLTNAINNGLSCLTKLAKKNPKKTFKGEISNLINHFNIQANEDVKPITLVCNEKEHNWSSSEIAHASVRDTKVKGMDIRHPFVSLNPSIKKTFFGGISNGPPRDELEGIIFHEMIHNFGYSHGSGVDITYGCEVCCFSDNKDAKESACNICRGNYKDEYNENYLRDVALMSKETFLASAEITFYQNLKEIPATQKNIDSLFISLSVRGPGAQAAFVKQLSFIGKKVSVNKDTKALLEDLKNYRSPNKWMTDINRVYSESILQSFIHKDDLKAISLINMINSKELEEVGELRASDSEEAKRTSRGLKYLKASLLNR